MTLSEYLVGRRIVLRSEHRKDWVIERIKSALPWPFGFMHRGVAGGVFFGWLRLVWNIPFFSNGFRPVFRGRLEEIRRGTEVRIVFGAPIFVRVFFVFWYFFLSVFTLIGVLSLIDAGAPGGSALMLVVTALLWVVLPGVHFLLNSNADVHYDAMLDLLAREADLRPVTAQ